MSVDSRGERSCALDTVLLAVGNRDDSRADALVETVREVAAPGTTRVVIAHVFDANSYREVVEQMLDAPTDDIEPDELAAQLSITRQITDQFEASGIECEPRATMETNGEGIVQIAEDVEAGRVVIGGRQRSPAGKAIFGSTAQEVMLNAPCPVTFVRDQPDE